MILLTKVEEMLISLVLTIQPPTIAIIIGDFNVSRDTLQTLMNKEFNAIHYMEGTVI